MHICFNINFLGLEGLGATLTSLIRNCSNSIELDFHFFCSNVSSESKNDIKNLLIDENYTKAIEFIDFDAKKEFGHLKSLHGDWTAYGRLLICEYLKSDTALYLDADLIISIDILKLNNFNFYGNVIAAVSGNKVISALENDFFIQKLNLPPDTDHFNSGVLYLNLKEWKESNATYQWKNIASLYPNELLSADQTLLNAMCKGQFALLPPEFNVGWYAGYPEAAIKDKSIIHFIGSPKPWDILGSLIHNGFALWKGYTPVYWKKKYCRISISKLKRAWKIKKSIIKVLLKNNKKNS